MSQIDPSSRISSPGSEVSTRISMRSRWIDAVWHLDGLRPGCNRSDYSLDWGFTLSDGSRFTDPRWASWCQAARTFLWSLKADPPPGSITAHDATMVHRFAQIRLLIRWMMAEGYNRFADLDRRHSGRPQG